MNEKLLKDKEYDHFFKIMMIGDDKTGKTSLLTRYIDNYFIEYKPTVSIKFQIKIRSFNYNRFYLGLVRC